jgi:hypothetical protein
MEGSSQEIEAIHSQLLLPSGLTEVQEEVCDHFKVRQPRKDAIVFLHNISGSSIRFPLLFLLKLQLQSHCVRVD